MPRLQGRHEKDGALKFDVTMEYSLVFGLRGSPRCIIALRTPNCSVGRGSNIYRPLRRYGHHVVAHVSLHASHVATGLPWRNGRMRSCCDSLLHGDVVVAPRWPNPRLHPSALGGPPLYGGSDSRIFASQSVVYNGAGPQCRLPARARFSKSKNFYTVLCVRRMRPRLGKRWARQIPYDGWNVEER